MVKTHRVLLAVVALTVALALACLWPVIWAYGHVAYLMIMPVDRAELTDGRGTIWHDILGRCDDLHVKGDWIKRTLIGDNW